MAYEWDFETALLGMAVGDSFFIPCLQVDEMRKTIQKEADRLQVRVKIRFVIEGELQGLRTWRVPL